MRLKLGLKLGIFIFAGFIAALTFTIQDTRTSQAAILNNNVPTDANSKPFDAHVFFMRKDTTIGRSDKTYLEAYYSKNMTPSEWNSATITIKPGAGDSVGYWRVCAPEGPATNKFLKVTLKKVHNPFGESVYYIAKDKVCTQKSGNNSPGVNGSNAFYATYPLPNGRPNLDPDTNEQYYKIEISIEYDDAPADAGAIRFQVNGNRSPKIGPRGNGVSFPILAKWSEHTRHTTSLSIPFGLACTEVNARTDRIGIYDADNRAGEFADNNLQFQVYDTDANEVVKLEAGSSSGSGKISSNRKTYNFDFNGNKEFAGAKLKMQPDVQYEMRITGLDPRNAIDVRVPSGTVFGDPDLCTEQWNMNGKSFVKDDAGDWNNAGDELVTIPYNYGQAGYTGGTIIAPEMKHSLRNIGLTNTSEAVKWRVKWGQYGPAGGTMGGNIKTSPGGGEHFNAKTDTTISGSGMNDFAIPTDADTGYRYCQYIEWWPDNTKVAQAGPSHPNYRKSSEPACITIEREPCIPGTHASCTSSVPTRFVNMVAKISVASNTETSTDAKFSGHVEISNFPKPEEGGWGYKERSSQHDAERQSAIYSYRGWNSSRTVCPSVSDQGTVGYAGATCSHEETRWSCGGTNGYTSDPGTCEVFSHWGPAYQIDGACKTKDSSGNCTEYYKVWTNDPVYATVNSSPYQITVYDSGDSQYNCLDGSGWSSGCPDRYYCPNGGSGSGWSSGGANSGWAYSSGQITCDVWQCKYPSASAGRTEDAMQNRSTTYKCSYRCDSSNGDKAYLSSDWNDAIGVQDRRCFVRPTFELTCFWEDGTSKTVNVSGDGNVCHIDDYYKEAGAIGTTVSAELKIKQISPYTDDSWNPSDPAPGTVTSSSGAVSRMYNWRWTKTDATASSNVVGYSYLKVYGGDVRVGGGVGSVMKSGVCNFASGAEIRTNNRGAAEGYNGSGVQYAAFATGTIDKLITGQYNEYIAEPDPGMNPKRLTFAGQSGAYGGNFGSVGPCYDYTGKLSSDAVTTSGSTVINGQVINNGQRVIRHVRGNVFIDGDIVYAGSGAGWVQPIDIPVYQLIVEGNIYISPNVTRLDGMYVAVPHISPSSGNIYTCATGFSGGSVPTTTFNTCKTQLVVNGSLSAKRIFPMRDCGSLSLAQASEPSLQNGGTDQQNCSADNHAAEIVNYSPEMWIRSAIGPARDTYDSLLSLPPVL